MTAQPKQAADASEQARVTRLLQRQIMPLDRDFDVRPLYFDPEEVRLDSDRYSFGGNRNAEDINNALLRQSASN